MAAVGLSTVTYNFKSDKEADNYIRRSSEIAGIYATFSREGKIVTVCSKKDVTPERFMQMTGLILPVRRASLRVKQAFINSVGLKSSF